MAKNDANLRTTGEIARVHKAKEVHKRRAAGRSADKNEEPSTQPRNSKDEGQPTDPSHSNASSTNGKGEGRSISPSRSGELVASGVAFTSEETHPLGQSVENEKTSSSTSAAEEQEADTPIEEEDGRAPKKSRWKKVVAVIACLIVAAALVFAGYVGGSRWIRYNDEADIQGSWYVYGTSVPLSFKNGSIAINADTSYAYRIDPTAKTIEYSLGNLAGQGRYWFNDERNILVITDGADYTMWSTLFDDLAYGIRHMFGETALPANENSIVLSRTVVQAPETPSGQANETTSETESASSDDSGKETTDMLSVSDIMVKDENASSNG